MWRNWWVAHEAEIIFELIFFTVLLAGILVMSIWLWWKNRNRT